MSDKHPKSPRDWREDKGDDYKHFSNTACRFYPCHGLAGQNCLFCFCPLYFLPWDCGGDYTLLANGVKDCSQCLIPHAPGGYEFVMGKLGQSFEKLDASGLPARWAAELAARPEDPHATPGEKAPPRDHDGGDAADE